MTRRDRPTLGLSSKYHSTDDSAGIKSASEYLDDSDRVDIKVSGVLGHDGERGLGDEVGQDAF